MRQGILTTVSTILIFFLTGLFGIAAQSLHYDFDQCSMVDDIQGDTAQVSASISCNCGLRSDAVLFDEATDSIAVTRLSDRFFEQDFAIRFYISSRSLNGISEVMTKKNGCLRDSSFSVFYNATTQQIRVELVESLSNAITLFGDLDQNNCWHELVIQRSGDEYSLYLDGVLSDRELKSGGVQIINDAPVILGRGPCTPALADPYTGLLDALSFFDRPLHPREYGLTLHPDQLLTRDTVIFIGDQVGIRSSINCATRIQWTPTSDVSDPNIANPIISPPVTSTYRVTYSSDQCILTDTLRIIVIDRNSLNCDQLDLPTAFTPNGDGINDVFGLSNPFIIESLDAFDIYDRTGAIVYSIQDVQDTWDGRFGTSNKLMPGVYVYKIRYQCQGTQRYKIGTVTILR